jgi:hypothetical protein
VSGSRLTILATTDERAFLRLAREMLASKQRLDREAALAALVEHPLPGARDAMHDLYARLHAGAPKSDHGGNQRASILRYLLKQPHPTDASFGALASESYERDSSGDDNTYNLRLLGLRLIGHVMTPEVVRFYAAEHLDDRSPHEDEPAKTALRLLADTGGHATIYYWLLGAARDSPNLLAAFEALAEAAPPDIVRRYIERQMSVALASNDESLCMSFAEAIVKLELQAAYPALRSIMDTKISDELYSYLAMLLAATNRPELLEILETQLRPGGRIRLVLQALQVRTTPEQQAIIDRWEQR